MPILRLANRGEEPEAAFTLAASKPVAFPFAGTNSPAGLPSLPGSIETTETIDVCQI